MTPLERDSRFDDLARFVSEGIPRRTALRRIGAFVAALAISGPAEALGATHRKKCPKGHALCGSRCCPSGYSCHTHRGRKTCTCASPKKVCSGTCINPRTDPRHCGSCGKRCKTGETCVSGKCKGKAPGQGGGDTTTTPTPTCTDGVRNGNETDVDCGGPTCPKCADGKACAAGTDCVSGVCTNRVCVTAPKVCTADVCGARNGCPPCADGQACGSAADCASGHCPAGICVQCAAATDCPAAAAGTCQSAVCTAGVCGFAADNTNTPADTVCTTGACVAGVPVAGAKPAHTACGAGLVCNATGQCIGCVDATDCPAAAAGSCQKASCTNGTCGFAADPTKDNTACGPVANQTVCCTGACIQLGTPQHCQSCHDVCAVGQHCCDPDIQGCTGQPCL